MEKDHWGDPDVDGRMILRLIESRYTHRVLVRKPDGKSPLGRPTRRWEANIKIDGGRYVHRVQVGKPEGKRPLGRPRR
jgi:hypothetical protein